MLSPDPIIKVSSKATGDFWKIPVLADDPAWLALNKPSHVLTVQDPFSGDRPCLTKLLHRDIAKGAAWCKARSIDFLDYAHCVDYESTGVFLLAKDKAALAALRNEFGSEKPCERITALVQGSPNEEAFEVDAKLASHPEHRWLMCITDRGKKSITRFEVVKRFQGYTLLNCVPLTNRHDQLRLHLKYKGLPLVGDSIYGGSRLFLSSLKRKYRLKVNRLERPLIDRAALHVSELCVSHPITRKTVILQAPLPKDLLVAIKYLKRYAG